MKPSSGGFSKNGLLKTFLNKGLFILGLFWPIFLFLSFPQFAHAGFFSNIIKFLTGSNEEVKESSLAAVSMPLLGSQAIATQLAVGGPIDSSAPGLSATQDNALVALRNPNGTLSNFIQDQILVYTVQPGDIPGLIAEKFGISLNTLLWANNIANPNLIKAGDELVILPVSGVKYEVKKGDTIEFIAKKFKGDVADILSFNGLVIDGPLEIGSIIIIPDGELIIPSAPSMVVSRFANLPELKGYYMRPIAGGRKTRGLHGFNGVDLAINRSSQVFASAEGVVIVARASGWNGGYGKYVVITHPNSTQTLYSHLDGVLIEVGRSVTQGTVIGLVGSTGNSTGPHVHFEVRGAKNPF